MLKRVLIVFTAIAKYTGNRWETMITSMTVVPVLYSGLSSFHENTATQWNMAEQLFVLSGGNGFKTFDFPLLTYLRRLSDYKSPILIGEWVIFFC